MSLFGIQLGTRSIDMYTLTIKFKNVTTKTAAGMLKTLAERICDSVGFSVHEIILNIEGYIKVNVTAELCTFTTSDGFSTNSPRTKSKQTFYRFIKENDMAVIETIPLYHSLMPPNNIDVTQKTISLSREEVVGVVVGILAGISHDTFTYEQNIIIKNNRGEGSYVAMLCTPNYVAVSTKWGYGKVNISNAQKFKLPFKKDVAGECLEYVVRSLNKLAIQPW